MTVWIVVESPNVNAARGQYRGLARRLNEKLGTPQFNAAGTHAVFGSSRIDFSEAKKMEGPNIQVYNSWPPPSGWEYPDVVRP